VFLELKQIYEKDWDFIRILRNENFEFFYQQNSPISKDHHFTYMKKQQKNQNFHHWFIYAENDLVGYVRILDFDVGIIIHKKFQRLGYATKALELAEIKAKKLGLTKLVALIRPENISSKKLFLKNNYKLKINLYEKELFT
jgi:RimJ/RimL family protein N-acetyltransferase